MAASRKFGLGYSQRKAKLNDMIQKLALPVERLDTNILNFSGGMHQKIIIARWLLLEPLLLILDEPTKGVDIGTRTSISKGGRTVYSAGLSAVAITELNRKRPPVDLLDFITFTTVAIFHAGDDRSAMESLESLPYLAQSVKAFIGSKPYHVGPRSIGLRMNPYGEAPITGSAAVLTDSEFELSTQNISAMDSLECEFADKRLTLAPYAVARLRA